MLVYTLRLHNGTHFLNTDRRENLKALLGCVSVGHIGLHSSLLCKFVSYKIPRVLPPTALRWLKCYEG